MLAGLCVFNVVVICVAPPIAMFVIGAALSPLQAAVGVLNLVSETVAGGWSGIAALWGEMCDVFVQAWALSGGNPVFRAWTLGVMVVAAIGQVMFIAPLVCQPSIVAGPRSMRASVLGAAVMAAMLTTCVVYLLCEAWHLMATLAEPAAPSKFGLGPAQAPPPGTLLTDPAPWLLVWLIMGFVWAYLLRRAGSAREPDFVARWFRWLLAGTVVEVALGVTVLAWIRKRDNCICAWSSYWVTVFGIAALLLLCGPAVILLVSHRARGRWARQACRQCGYQRRTNSATCSECGGLWDGEQLPGR